ncbi:transcription initiation factor TFIID subunit 4-like isoform X1 [Gordionus sp. m RMFG-2023]|uniref:transcription initiation factor TFIID subunit 4-like isoform X1 n=1 Tax=Gordionus sp. m RMFG-2023 TaxID=3053472 RepID=UPI0031FBF792
MLNYSNITSQTINLLSMPMVLSNNVNNLQSQNLNATFKSITNPTLNILNPIKIENNINVNLSSNSTLNANSVAATYSTNITPDMAKKKCKNFLSTLLKLAFHQPLEVALSVKSLIQGLVDNNVTPEEFTKQLQNELNSSPQPCLIPFLKKSLPYLQISLCQGEITIDGIKPPSLQAILMKQNNMEQIQSLITAINTSFNKPITSSGPAPQTTLHPNYPLSSIPNTPSLAFPANSSITDFNGQLQQLQLLQRNLSLMGKLNTNINANTVVNQNQILSSPAVLKPIQLPAITNVTQNLGMNSILRNQSSFSLPYISNANHTTTNTLNILSHPNIMAGRVKSEIAEPSSPTRDEDDINDVTAMGGINISEEKQRILAGSSDFIGFQIRSCADQTFLNLPLLSNRIDSLVRSKGLASFEPDVARIVSHAIENRFKMILSKLSIIADHRKDIYKMDNRYETVSDVKAQFKFLEEIDHLEKKRKDEQEKEILFRLAKRAKHEDPEQLKLKQKVKEMQIAQMEETRQMEANLTALAAIGPRKKKILTNSVLNNSDDGTSNFNDIKGLSHGTGTLNTSSNLKNRNKRVTLKDFILYLEQEKDTCRSTLLYKCYLR